MKPQDIIFVVILAVLLFRKDAKLFAISGVTFLFLSMPLFNFWIFFTAQRFVLYACICFSLCLLLVLLKQSKV